MAKNEPTQVCTCCHQARPIEDFAPARTGARSVSQCIACRLMKRESALKYGSHPVQLKPKSTTLHKCHDCPKMTTDYRCPACLKLWRALNGVSDYAVENAGNDIGGMGIVGDGCQHI